MAVSGILTALGPLCITFGIEENDDKVLSHTLFSGGIVAILLGIVLAVVQQNKTKNHVESIETRRAKSLTAFNDTHAAMSKAISDLVRSKQQVADVNAFFSVSVVSAPSLMPTTGFRICIYRLDSREEEKQDDAPDSPSKITEILQRVDYGGRADAPRLQFTDDTPYGRHLIDIAKGTSPWIVSDPNSDELNGIIDRKPGSSWHSFIAVPLKFNEEPRGVITIDSRQKTVFTQEHLSIGWAISDYITLGMTLGKSGTKDPAPELAAIFDAIRRESSGETRE